MKRKKWSELEEQTLLTKYSELLSSGALAKLKTREKKFKPIAEHVNLVHNLDDPVTFPFKWSWRDVSIKVQNMRHQYLGVKQKIQVSKDEFNWKDGENHWENFLKYKEVFGDVELDGKGKRSCENDNFDVFGDCGDLGFGIDCEDLEEEEDEEEEEHLEEEEEDGTGGDDDNRGEEYPVGEFGGEREIGDMGMAQKRKLSKVGLHKRLGLMSAQVLDLQNMVVKREEGRRERECRREKGEAEREERRKEVEFRREKRRNEQEDLLEDRELELQEREVMWTRREFEKRLRLQGEFDEERQRRMRMEERREEEELEWWERMIGLQIQHEKQMMQMHAEACQNQMQILGVMASIFIGFSSFSTEDHTTLLTIRRMRIVGLTGGISSRKSTVSNLFKAHDIPVAADIVAHDILKKGTGGWKKVVSAFGQGVLQPDGEVDRPKLGQIVFSNPKKRQLLN